MTRLFEPCRWVYLNDRLVPLEKAFLRVDNHAIHFGAAAFESLRVYSGRQGPAVLGLARHVERLHNSLHPFAAPAPALETIEDALWRTIDQNSLQQGYLRLLVFPTADCSEFDPSRRPWGILVLAFREGEPSSRIPAQLAVSPVRRPPIGSTLPRAKLTGFYAADVAAHVAAHSLGFDDALILHEDGSVCEVTGANFFIVRNRQLRTPVLPSTIDGITRRLVFELAALLEIPVQECMLSLSDVAAADEVFITGTYHEIREVSLIAGCVALAGAPGAVTRQLQQCFRDVTSGQETRLSSAWLTSNPLAPLVRHKEPVCYETGPAGIEDVEQIVEAVRRLLEELRAAPSELPAGAATVCRDMIEKKMPGAVFVARERQSSTIVGILAASIQQAIHQAGSYALIQELWVDPKHRSYDVGAALIEALERYCRDSQLTT